MAHFALLWKARTIEKYRQRYENEKINSIFMSSAEVPDTTLSQRWKHYRHGMQKRLSRTFSKWYPEGSTVSNFLVSLRKDMKLASILMRGFYGFIGGLLLTYLGFMFFVFQLSLSMMHATILSSVLGVLLTLGLTFSNRTRCLVLLLVPQLFSRVGMYTLTCYALVLILTGPATNTLRNSEVLSESMACSQEHIKLSVKEINDSMKKPYNSIKYSLKITMQSMKAIVAILKTAIININRLILSIALVIEVGFKWLGYVAEVCNEALKNPHEKCLNIITESAIKDSVNYNLNRRRKHEKKTAKSYIKDLLHAFGIKNVKIPHDGAIFGNNKELVQNPEEYVEEFFKNMEDVNHSVRKDSLDEKDGISTVAKEFKGKNKNMPWQNVTNIAEKVCSSMKSCKKFFTPPDIVEETFVATIRKKLQTFVSRVRKLIYVSINIQHTYSYIGNSSSNNQVTAGVVTEIRNRADPILTWLSWSSCVTSLFILLIIFRAKHYQHMFETSSRFDNRFITKEFRKLDLDRLRKGKETVLPLNTRERAKYVTTTSFRLVASEKVHLNRSAVFMTVTTFKLLIHIVADYSLYWVLITIRHHGKLQTLTQPGAAYTGASITGEGFISRLLQAFVNTMNNELLFPLPDKSCLPNPFPPDIKRYCQIGFLIFLLWFFALLEPYGLRMRHLIMGHYKPQRAKRRAVWLYTHILTARASFMKFARRKLHREFKYSSHSKFTFRKWLLSCTLIRWVTRLVGISLCNEPRCLLCNMSEDSSDVSKEIIKCEVPGCPGSYCTSCFSDIGQMCTICLDPSDYGDLSDASLERESSDENDSDDEDDNNDHDNDNYPNRSNEPDFDNNSHKTEDSNDDDVGSSRRFYFKRQSSFSVERNENDSESTPLLKHSINTDKCINTQPQLMDKIFFKKSANENKRIILYLMFNRQKNLKLDSNDTIVFENVIQMNRSPIATVKILLYSVYKITINPFVIVKFKYTTNIAKYLRKNKILRRKKCFPKECNNSFKITSIRENYTKCGNSKSQTKNRNTTVKISKNNSNINIINRDNDCNKNTDGNFDMESKNILDLTKLENGNAEQESIQYQASIIKYWNNVKWLMTSCSFAKKTTEDEPTTRLKHMRKKKRKKRNLLSSTEKILKKREKTIGNSRLFAYLDEHDWVKDFNNDKAQRKFNANNNDQGHIIVNNIMIPRLNLNLSSDSIDNEEVCDLYQCKVPEVFVTKSETVARCSLKKVIKSIIGSSCNMFEHTSDEDNAKRTRHFRSDDKCEAERKEIDLMKNDSAFSEISIDPEPLHSSESCISSSEKRNRDIKRIFSQPLSLMKFVYSSLILNKHESNAEKLSEKDKCPIGTIETIIKVTEPTNNELDTLKKNKHKTKIVENQVKNQKEVKKDENKNSRHEMVQNRKSTRAVIYMNEDTKSCHKKKLKEYVRNKGKKIQTTPAIIKRDVTKTDDKQVTALPEMISCGCQNAGSLVKTQELGVQATGRKMKCQGCDAPATNPTCTCAVQCPKYNINSGIQQSKKSNTVKKVVTQRKQEEISSQSSSSVESIQCDSEETITDATICSLPSVDYYRMKTPRKEHKPLKVKVVTKSNQSTLTERSNHRDASTATYDWWSPIVERKGRREERGRNREYKPVERKRREFDMRKTKTYRNKGVSAGEKVVTFRSKTQFIPSRSSVYEDVMSPSRYLLESQKYYNELFYNLFTSPRVYPITHFQKLYNAEKDRSQSNSYQQRRRGRKTKRLEESYTPRRNMQPYLWTKKVDVVKNVKNCESARRNKRI